MDFLKLPTFLPTELAGQRPCGSQSLRPVTLTTSSQSSPQCTTQIVSTCHSEEEIQLCSLICLHILTYTHEQAPIHLSTGPSTSLCAYPLSYHPHICLPVYPLPCIDVYLSSAYPSICSSVVLSILPVTYPSSAHLLPTYSSIHLSIHPSTLPHPFLHPTTCLSTCPSSMGVDTQVSGEKRPHWLSTGRGGGRYC